MPRVCRNRADVTVARPFRNRADVTVARPFAWVGDPADDPYRDTDWDEPLRAPALRSIDLAEIPHDRPEPLWIDRLDPEGHTILFGPGGVGKGAVACSWIVELVRTGRYVLILDYEGHAGEWSRRIHSLDPVAHASGLIRYLTMTQPLHEAAGLIQLETERLAIDYVFIDSAVLAAGGDPLKPEIPARYASALVTLGVPVTSLAHITKGKDANRYPFGSVFWHNYARMTWSLTKSDETGATTLRQVKSSNYAPQGPYSLDVYWCDGSLERVEESGAVEFVIDRVCEALSAGPADLGTIIGRMALQIGRSWSRDTIRRTLARNSPKRVISSGGVYSLVS